MSTHSLIPFRPLGDKLVVTRVDDLQAAYPLVHVVESKPRSMWAAVLAVGPKVEGIKPGDTVVMGSWGGQKLLVGEGAERMELITLEQRHVHAVLDS